MLPLKVQLEPRLRFTGSGFGDKKGKVLIGTVAAKVTSWTNTRITCIGEKGTPPGGALLGFGYD